MTRFEKIELKGWRPVSTANVGGGGGGVGGRNTQVGQLLYYLVAVQLSQIQQYLSPLKGPNDTLPTDVLGLFMEQGKVCYFKLYLSSTTLSRKLTKCCLAVCVCVDCQNFLLSRSPMLWRL